jgi:hypothetical protein
LARGSSRGGRGAARALAVLFVAAACGWVIMELEILGARILAPYFGSAIYVVMGSVIGVFLLSLAAGYMLGGRLSRSPHSKRALGAAVALAGAWLCGLPLAIDAVCEAILRTGLDVKWGSLAASFALFAAPTVLLGTVSPTAVHWLTQRSEEAGPKAGLVLAVSTVASFAGCVTTAFYLVLLSVRATLHGTGAAMLILGGLVLLHGAVRDLRSGRRGG